MMKHLSSYTGVWGYTKHFIAGSASGVALVLAGHAFDTIKVRLQTDGMNGKFRGPIHCLMVTLKDEGVCSHTMTQL